MVRVNLLPSEVIDRRKYEQWYRYVFIGVVGLVLILLFAYVGILMATDQKNNELQALREESQQFQSQADVFGVFETREQELIAREQVAQTALAGRTNVGMLLEEVSLVLPEEVWLGTLAFSEKEGLAMAGFTPRSTSESVDIAYKSIAKLLVRLNELASLKDVWLASAVNTEWTAWSSQAGAEAPLPVKVVGFNVTGMIEVPAAISTPATGAVVPAPVPAGN